MQRVLARGIAEEHAAHDAARFRLAWALAHSRRSGDGERAVELLREEGYAWGDTVQARDRRYITAVAQYNEGDYLAARARRGGRAET